MANIKISDLTAAAAASGTQEFEVNDALTSKKVTGAQVLSYVHANTAVADVNGLQTALDGKLATTNGAVGESNLANNAVTTNKINNGAVTDAKIADSAVTDAKIANGAVTASKLAAGVGGKVLQVVTNFPTSAAVYSQAVSSFSEISTDYRTSITPISSTSNLIIEWVGLIGGNNNGSISTMRFWDVTNNASVGLSGLSLGSRSIGHGSFRQLDSDNNDRDNIFLRTIVPSGSTSARTYTIQHFSENSVTKYFNATATDNSGCSYVKWHFIIMEVAA
jgi:hypothetical protein